MLAGCQLEENFAPKAKGSAAFYGTIEGATRTELAADGDVYHVNWVTNDRVSINGEFYYAAEGGSSYTYFPTDTTGGGPVGPFEAYYPAEIAPAGENPGMLPAIQTYKEGTTSCIPMMAQSETYNLTFKNLCSMLKLNITTTEADAAVKKIEVKADQPMAGEYTVIDNAAVVAAGTGVTLTCPKPVAVGAAEVPFFVSVPANTYTGMTVTVTLANGKTQTVKMKADASAVLERSKVYEAAFPFNNFADAPAVTGKAVLLPGPDFNAAIKSIASGALLEDEDLSIKRIIFDVLSTSADGIVVSDASSEVPVYASFEKGSGALTISTAADKIYLNEDASMLFYRINALQAYENLNVLNSDNTTNMSYMFCQMTPTYTELYDLKDIDLSWINTENVVDMSSMFNSVRGVKNLDVSKFNTSNVENMRYMFGNCRSLESIDLTNFDFSKDTSMAYMFYYNEKITEIKFPENINTSSVENFRDIFYNCEILPSLDVSKFDTSSACDMYGMFYYCGTLTSLDISNFDFSMDSTMSYFFAYDSALVDLVLPKEIDCSEMQYLNSAFRCVPLATFDMDIFKNTENILGTRYMFAYCKDLNKVTSKEFDFSSNMSAAYMFGYACENSMKLDLSEFDVSTNASFTYMFYRNWAATLNLDNWDTSCATTMTYMFFQLRNLNTLTLGDDFINPSGASPTCLFCGADDKTSGRQTASVPGALNVYCNQTTADWLATTTLRRIRNGYYTGVGTPVNLFDNKTKAPLTVTWAD